LLNVQFLCCPNSGRLGNKRVRVQELEFYKRERNTAGLLAREMCEFTT
jgi:hypothetical protein